MMNPLLVVPDTGAMMGALHWLLVIVAAAVAVLVVYFLVREMALRWYFKGNRAAIAIWKNRRRVRDEMELKLGMMSRTGRVRVAPKQSASWKRAGVSDELANLVHEQIMMRFTPGGVTFTTPVKLPEKVEGRPAAKGVLTLGVDTETGEPGTIRIKECSGVVVGALPGSGKTVLLDAMVQALEGQARVTSFDGKLQTAAEMTPELERLREIMQARLTSRLDFWAGDHNQQLQIVVADECQVLFEPEGSSKEEKAEERRGGCTTTMTMLRG